MKFYTPQLAPFKDYQICFLQLCFPFFFFFVFVIQALIEGIHLATSPHIRKTTADTNDPH